jgi:hypothetical protein
MQLSCITNSAGQIGGQILREGSAALTAQAKLLEDGDSSRYFSILEITIYMIITVLLQSVQHCAQHTAAISYYCLLVRIQYNNLLKNRPLVPYCWKRICLALVTYIYWQFGTEFITNVSSILHSFRICCYKLKSSIPRGQSTREI